MRDPIQPDLQQRIVGIHLAHTPSGAEGCCSCWCGERFNGFGQHAAHVAGLLVSELGLTLETAPSMPHWSRYVTEWVQDA